MYRKTGKELCVVVTNISSGYAEYCHVKTTPYLPVIEAVHMTLATPGTSLHTHEMLCYSNTTVYYGIHERSECIPVDSGVTNLIHDRRSCVDFMLEVEANVSRCVH